MTMEIPASILKSGTLGKFISTADLANRLNNSGFLIFCTGGAAADGTTSLGTWYLEYKVKEYNPSVDYVERPYFHHYHSSSASMSLPFDGGSETLNSNMESLGISVSGNTVYFSEPVDGVLLINMIWNVQTGTGATGAVTLNGCTAYNAIHSYTGALFSNTAYNQAGKNCNTLLVRVTEADASISGFVLTGASGQISYDLIITGIPTLTNTTFTLGEETYQNFEPIESKKKSIDKVGRNFSIIKEKYEVKLTNDTAKYTSTNSSVVIDETTFSKLLSVCEDLWELAGRNDTVDFKEVITPVLTEIVTLWEDSGLDTRHVWSFIQESRTEESVVAFEDKCVQFLSRYMASQSSL